MSKARQAAPNDALGCITKNVGQLTKAGWDVSVPMKFQQGGRPADALQNATEDLPPRQRRPGLAVLTGEDEEELAAPVVKEDCGV